MSKKFAAIATTSCGKQVLCFIIPSDQNPENWTKQTMIDIDGFIAVYSSELQPQTDFATAQSVIDQFIEDFGQRNADEFLEMVNGMVQEQADE